MTRVIVPASGIGARFGGNSPKQFTELGGRHILHHTLLNIAKADVVDEIIVAVPEGFSQTVKDYGVAKVAAIVEGGQSRTESVYRALQVMPRDTEIVLIHDGVRPFVSVGVINDVVAAVREHGAVVACTPVTDTIKRVSAAQAAPHHVHLVIEETPERSALWQAQTPQGFTYEIIRKAYEEGLHETATDDSYLVERLGLPVVVVPSEKRNIKITTSEDLVVAEAMLAKSSPPTSPEGNVTIYTDGACSGNPGPGGYGVVLIFGEHRKEISGGEPQTTNNRMEIMGVIAGLEALTKPCNVDLYSDSRYVVDAIEKGWVKRWRENNWMRNKKDAALNVDLWERMLPLLEKHTVAFHWVKGHAGHPENERCDQLAREQIGAEVRS